MASFFISWGGVGEFAEQRLLLQCCSIPFGFPSHFRFVLLNPVLPMKKSLAFATLFLTLILGVLKQQATANEPSIEDRNDDRPNIVLFFIDDLGYMDLGCYGSSFYETPNIDALAARSVRFTDFYSANPVCSPTRAALMTGKAPQRVGITQWINQPNDIHLPLAEVTIGEALASAGYKTGYIGKWHLGEKDNQQPREQGFTWMRGVNRAGAPGSYFFPFKRKRNKNSSAIAYWDVPDLDNKQDGDYLTDGLTDHALSFITENKDRPFFLCFAHYAVHTPIQAPDALVQKYKRKAEQSKTTGPDFLPERNEAKTRIRQDNPTYAAMIENLDTNVGRVLEQLEKHSLRNTIVIFTSDNGGLSTLKRIGPTSCRPLRAGKGWTYEGGIRIPTMIGWIDKIKPGVNSTPAITMDLYPTLLELAGLPQRPNQHLDGHSLVSTLSGEPDDKLKDRFLAWTYPHNHGSQHTPSEAIRSGDWKLVHRIDENTPNDQRYELYNLAEDIGETKNLAVKNFEKTHELAKMLSEWIVKTTPTTTNE